MFSATMGFPRSQQGPTLKVNMQKSQSYRAADVYI